MAHNMHLFLFAMLVESGLGNLGAFLAPLWLAIILVGWGVLLGYWLDSLGTQAAQITDEVRRSRRSALIKMAGGSAAVILAAWGLGSLLKESQASTGAGQPLETLKIIKEDVEAGKFSRDIFEKFCYSLI